MKYLLSYYKKIIFINFPNFHNASWYLWTMSRITQKSWSPIAKHNPAIFSVPQELQNLISPSRQTKNPDNSNVLYMFNNNTYIDFRTACNHVLIPSCVIQVI